MTVLLLVVAAVITIAVTTALRHALAELDAEQLSLEVRDAGE
ncbi:hypothetical protein [Microbacterium hominis]|nr:hypothetical protein [Microbacterium hominis]